LLRWTGRGSCIALRFGDSIGRTCRANRPPVD
jgi:hypothetical protein